MNIYISGSITQNPKFLSQFTDAEIDLKVKYPGSKIFNPARIALNLPKLTHEQYMKLSFAEMSLCDAVYFLKGWESSIGANQEYGYAVAKGMKIMYEE